MSHYNPAIRNVTVDADLLGFNLEIVEEGRNQRYGGAARRYRIRRRSDGAILVETSSLHAAHEFLHGVAEGRRPSPLSNLNLNPSQPGEALAANVSGVASSSTGDVNAGGAR